jgi:hypothetical protein
VRVGKLSVLACLLAPALGVTAARLLPAGEQDAYSVGPISAGLSVFAVLTLAGGLIGALAWSRGSPAGVFVVVWAAFALVALGLWAASFSLGV